MQDWLDDILNKTAELDWDEILINGPASLEILTKDRKERKKSPFRDEEHFIDCLQDFCFRQNIRLDPYKPAAGGWYGKENLRWHILLPPLSRSGPLLSLRRHRFQLLTLDDFDCDKSHAEILQHIMSEKESLLICGPTGSGKTTFLHSLLETYCREDRLIVIESLAELPLRRANWIGLQTTHENIQGKGGFGLSYLFSQALRLRPDRFVLGEIRTEEAELFFELEATGHGGCLATIHSSSIEDLKARFLALVSKDYLKMAFSSREKSMWAVFLERAARPKIKNLKKLTLEI